MSSFQMLEQREEDELHKSRLLNVEEKPFKRITKRLLTPGSLLTTPSKLPTPPPESNSSTQESETASTPNTERSQFREDVILDFAAFDSSLARIQFLQNSNALERARYRADKERILDTARLVRDNTGVLRGQLDEAKARMEQRKVFDGLAEKIMSNKLLRAREDQERNLRKLEEECRELERESEAYVVTWRERKEQFGRIVEQGLLLRRLIRDEKEEDERREGMDGDGDGAADGEDGEVGDSQVERGGLTPKHLSGNATPRPDSSGDGLKPRSRTSGSLSRPGSRTNSRGPSPAPSERRRIEAEAEADSLMTDSESKIAESEIAADTPMAEGLESQIEAETPRVTIDEPLEDSQAGLEEGETQDKMDTT